MLAKILCLNVFRAAENYFLVDPGFRFSPPGAIHIELLRSYDNTRRNNALSSTYYAPFSGVASTNDRFW
jgi:hypothetical protein